MAQKILVAVFSLLLLCAGIAGLVLLYLWLISYITLLQSQRRRHQSEENDKSPKQQGLSAADLQRLPTIECHEEEGEERRFAVHSGGGGNNECAVCLDDFQIGDRCRVIPACGHAFHVQCADAWLSKRSVCPICRTSARESKGNNRVNAGAVAAALPEESGRDHDHDLASERRPPPPAESVVVDIPIAIMTS